MKLVKILAKGLEEWPEHTGAAGISQDGSRALNRLDHGVEIASADKCPPDVATWPPSTWTRFSLFEPAELATDHTTAIVTRSDWEAERAKLKAPKANGDGWIRNRGGKCPVEPNTIVIPKFRSGDIGIPREACQLAWSHTKEIDDVMRYKIHKPAEQPAPVSEPESEMLYDPVAQGPLQWRDRIRELDTQRAEVEKLYQRQISEITQERELLVQNLAGEGLALVEVVVRPVEDMLDCKNWKRGDKVACLSDFDDQFTSGALYQLRADVENGHVKVVMDDLGKENGWGAHNSNGIRALLANGLQWDCGECVGDTLRDQSDYGNCRQAGIASGHHNAQRR
jgi:hypothetical protein